MTRRRLRVAGAPEDRRLALAIDLHERYPLLGDAVLETGQPWLDAAAIWQLDDMAALLDLRGPKYHVMTRPRGASKSSDAGLAALVIMATQLEPMAQCYTVASDAGQGMLVLRAMRGWIVRCPVSSPWAEITAHLSKVVTPTGVTMEVIPADSSSAYGLTPALVIVDEIGQWGSGGKRAREVWVAVWSSVAKRRDCRLAILTTTPPTAHWSQRIVAHAESSPRWRYSAVTEAVPWQSSADHEEQAALLLDEEYERLHRNRTGGPVTWAAPAPVAEVDTGDDDGLWLPAGAGPMAARW